MKPYYVQIILAGMLCIFTANTAFAQRKNGGHEQLRHVVVVTFKPGATAAQIQAVDDSFRNLAKLSMVKKYEWGLGSDDRDTQHVKHVYVTTFAGKKEEAAYGASPEHQAHIKLGAEYIESVSATDYFVKK